MTRALKQAPPDGYCDTANPFSDVTNDRWSCKYIKRLYELGITTGYGDGRYGPDDPVTRAQMAVFLKKAFSLPHSTTPRVAAFYFNRYATLAVDGYWRFWDAANQVATYSPPQDIACDYYPLLGPYSVNNAWIVDQHLAWLERAGIGLIVVEWQGPGAFEELMLPLSFERAALTRIKIAFTIEPYVGRSAQSLVEDIKHIYREYASLPAFFRTTERSRNKPKR